MVNDILLALDSVGGGVPGTYSCSEKVKLLSGGCPLRNMINTNNDEQKNSAERSNVARKIAQKTVEKRWRKWK